MNTHTLNARAAAATAAIEAAQNPMAKRLARQEGLAVKAELEKVVADASAVAAIKAAHARPQNSFGMFKSAALVPDRPVFMLPPSGLKVVSVIKLPNGTTVLANPAGQVPIPLADVPTFVARGWVRANDTAKTPL